MPIPRNFDRRPPERDQTRVNERIRVKEVRLVDENGEQVGIVPTERALAYAQERDLDLVEVAAQSSPPVCRVLDYSKYKYELEQKAKAARKHQQQINVREIKLRPKIAQHDYETKRGHVLRFLKGQDKVKVTIMFRGREQAHPDRGRKLLQRLFEDVQEFATIEQHPQQEGRNMHMMLAPVKPKQVQGDGTEESEPAAETPAEAPAPAETETTEPEATPEPEPAEPEEAPEPEQEPDAAPEPEPAERPAA